MENNSNAQSSQGRFLIAAVLCLLVLFGWQYWFAPKKPVTDANANTAANVAANTAPATPAPTQAPPTDQQPQNVAVTPDNTPNRKITIKSELYEVTIDSKGALATSWIIKRNGSPKGEFAVYADGSNAQNEQPLQLIGQKALEGREIPFRLFTDDQNLNSTINDRNYQISVPDDTITLKAGEERPIDFTFTDASGVEVKKSFVFRADSFIADLGVTVKKGGQPVPNTRLLIGASIGDHAIAHHNFYHIEPEAVAFVSGDVKRHQGASFTFDANNQSTMTDQGSADWVAVGDAYFSMAAVPATPAQNVEYRATKYDVQVEPFYNSIFQWVLRNPTTQETRHLVTAYVPVTADGSVTKIYTGTKDYFLLNSLGQKIADTGGRSVDLTNLINFSSYWWLRWMTKPIAILILYALNFFNALTHNYGVAIIIFTLLFYSLLFPLRWSQSRSFKKASGNAPKMKEIQDKIKDLQKKGVPTDDPRMRELQMQQLKLTKDALPIGGCLPMILQFPLLIAFYTAVTVSLEVRQASFLWLPDLSAADPFHVLEFAFALSMILSMKFTPQAATVTPEQATQQKMMTYFMPLMMLYVMWTAPSGLLLYWFAGNIVSFGQQMLINRLNKPNVPPGTSVVDTVPKGAKQIKPKLAT
ncbi:MAG: membrane protein insertase YidC [Pyrinomonadaceae bacterium]